MSLAAGRWFGLEIGATRLAVQSTEVATVIVRPAAEFKPVQPLESVRELLVHEGAPLVILSARDVFEGLVDADPDLTQRWGEGQWVLILKTDQDCKIGVRLNRAVGPFRFDAAESNDAQPLAIEHSGHSWQRVRVRPLFLS